MKLSKNIIVRMYFFGWVVYFLTFWSRAVFFDKAGNFVAGHINIWGDWAAHFSMGASMAYRSLIPFSSPFVIGEKLSYPFLTNFLAALLVRVGMPFFLPFVLLSFIGSLTCVIALYFFYKTLFRSRAVAVISSLIFLFNGGVGFWFFIEEVASSAEPLKTALNFSQQLTDFSAQHIRWISVINSMLIPQRSFNLGFPLALIALTLIWQKREHLALEKKLLWKKIFSYHLWISVVIIGLMPVMHTHSFIAIFLILACWSLGDLIFRPTQQKKNFFIFWAAVAAGVTLVSLPLLKFFFIGHVNQQGFLKYFPGWLAKEFKISWLLFWWKNWTIVPVFAVVGYAVAIKKAKHTWLRALEFLPFFLIFGVANLFLFQPWAWDNTKLLVWASLMFSGCAGYLLHQLYQANQKLPPSGLWLTNHFVVLSLLLFMTASGAFDAYLAQRVDLHNYVMYTAEELRLAEWARVHTAPESVWASDTRHNNWVYNLAGRQVILAFPGWVWSYGYNYRPLESDLQQIYRGTGATSSNLLQKYNVDYVVVNPHVNGLQFRDAVRLNTDFTQAYKTENYTIYQRKK